MGGVWYWNRYPGAACDVESLVYMPLLEELGYIPRDRYAKAAEILGHAQAIARRYGLYEGALFHTKVSGIQWDEATARWLVSTDRDDLIRARFVILANGPLSMPRLPEEIRGDVVRAGDRSYRVDCLIFATGFEWNTSYTHKIGFDATGRGGLTLSQKWAEGVSTLHGLMTRGFPNLFIMPGPNGQAMVTENFGHSIQENGRHVAHIVGEAVQRDCRTVEVTERAEADWVGLILDRRRNDAEFLRDCTPGRGNSEGRPAIRPPRNANYGGSAPEFYARLAAWRADGSLPGLTLS